MYAERHRQSELKAGKKEKKKKRGGGGGGGGQEHSEEETFAEIRREKFSFAFHEIRSARSRSM